MVSDYSSSHNAYPRVRTPPSLDLFLSKEARVDTHGVCLGPIVLGWVALSLEDTIAGHKEIGNSHRALVLGQSSYN